jgi:hypothetical protein
MTDFSSLYDSLRKSLCEEMRATVRRWTGDLGPDEEFGTTPERLILNGLFVAFQVRHGEHTVRDLFAEFAPKKKRELSTDRRELIARLYGYEGKPPKLQYARRLARINAAMLRDGRPRRELYGSGTTNADNMHDYLKKTLREKKYRDVADRTFAMRQQRGEHF